MIFKRLKKMKLPALDLRVYRSRSENGLSRIVVLVGFAVALLIILKKLYRYHLRVENVEIEDAADLVEQERDNPDFVILDVRTPTEFERGHIAVAIDINYRSGTFRTELGKLDKEKVYLVYSSEGERSGKAANIMKALGFKNVFHLADGLNAWEHQGLAIVR